MVPAAVPAAPTAAPADPSAEPDSQIFLSQYHQTLTSALPVAALAPRILEQYDFESCLKYRTDKQVYLIRQRQTNQLAILRIMPDNSLTTNPAPQDQEAAIMADLDFPGVPKAYDSFIENGQSYLIREYLPGRPLEALLANGALDLLSLCDYGDQLCAILSYLHSRQPMVVHRDIKPANIIVSPEGRIGLTDFGIARLYKPESLTDTSFAGTLLFAPPEQFGFSQSTPLSDIYALGIVLLCLATASPLRQGLENVRNRRLRSIISRCIAFDPADRYQDAAEVREQLKRLAQSERQQRRRVVGFALRLASAAGLLLALGALSMSSWLADTNSTEGAGEAAAADYTSLQPQSSSWNYRVSLDNLESIASQQVADISGAKDVLSQQSGTFKSTTADKSNEDSTNTNLDSIGSTAAGAEASANKPISDFLTCSYGVYYLTSDTRQLSLFLFSDGSSHVVVEKDVLAFRVIGEWVYYNKAVDDTTSELHKVYYDGTADQLVWN
ncbi:MAG: serine/threonine protein kinase [Actinomycetia bacterium]|nr:serine/threonine protein kinase [Actinomycetes bacterium]